MIFESLCFNIISLVLCFFIAIYLYLKHLQSYWQNKNVQCKEPSILFGNFKEFLLMRKSPGEISKQMYEEFPNERFVGTYLLTMRYLIIRDPELIKAVMTEDFYHFYQREPMSDPKVDPMSLNLFQANGDLWRVLRQNLTPLFSSAKLKNMFNLMTESGQHFEDYMRNTIDDDETPINVSEIMQNYSMEVIGSCAFGIKVNTMDDTKDNIFKRIGHAIFEASLWKTFKFLFFMIAPRLVLLLKIRINDIAVDNFFINLVKDTVEEREKSQNTRHDFIDLMKNLKREGKIKGNGIKSLKGNDMKLIEIEVDENLMAAQSMIFFAAGYETSSTTMSYALYELAMNTDIQTKVLEEIDSVLKNNNNIITYDCIKDLVFLDMVVNETLRKYPVLANLTRECTSTYNIPDTDIIIDKGVKVFIPLLAIHNDPQYYPDPDKFDPYRFTKEQVNERHPYVYMPFGQGPRICIGLRFGKAQVMVGLISLLRNYTVHRSEKTPDKISFHPSTINMSPKGGIWLTLRKRTEMFRK